MISVLRLPILLLLYNGLTYRHFAVIGHPLTQAPEWISVERSLTSPDAVTLSSCSKSCRTFPGMSINYNSSSSCLCECSRETPTFLPSARSCVSRLDECWRQIRFETSEVYSGWLPTLTIPSTDSIFAPLHHIAWQEAKIKFSADGRVNCSVSNVFVQSDGFWSQKNNTELFRLEAFNKTSFLKWVGNEADAQSLEGSVVQLKLTCSKYGDNAYCIGFRIAGVHVNTHSFYHASERDWNRIELIVSFLLAILLILTIFGSVILWSVCWRMKKGKLIANVQTQFLFHLKQQQMFMEEQITAIRANCVRQVERNYEERLQIESPTKQFLEPEVMANPPPMAQQFIVELRKMIVMAKEKIRLKRHTPTLDTIREEECDEQNSIEIPSPEVSEKAKPEGSSPKSTKSTDSGVESLSDEETRSQQKPACIEPEPSVETEKRPASRIPVVSTAKHSIVSQSHRVLQPSRLPTFELSRSRPSIIPSPPLPPKPSFLREPKITAAEMNSIIAEEVSSKTSGSLSSAVPKVSPPRSPPDIDEVISNIPPPLPESPPPQLPSTIRTRIKNRKPKSSYAVFPSETMTKKSLPRRIRRPTQLQQFLNSAALSNSSP